MKKIIHLFFLIQFFNSVSAQYNEWTWMSGDNITNQPGLYGTQGVPATANKPAARYEGGEWLDLQGNFWLFGGQDFSGNKYNDLWKYDPVANLWTWMKGDSITGVSGVYGTIGVPNIANTPGARDHGSATCVDGQGNFWLFGGVSISGAGLHNDLWKYSPVTNMWTWISGTQQVNQGGVYGTQGVPSVTNIPGSRCETDAMWADSAGYIWLFGGRGYDASGTAGYLNDLWKFNPATNEWTWVKGGNAIAQAGVYGTQGVPSPSNVPGSRMVYSAWKDLSGNFWIWGGWVGTIINVPYDDLWRYNPVTNEWTWMKGTSGFGNTTGTYGTQCTDASAYNPPAVGESRARWADDCGNFWLWGGCDGANYRNDLWRYSHATGNWTWVSGFNIPNQAGTYGTQGVSAPTNMPGTRRGSFAFRQDGVNELWFFGGGLPSVFNDLWRYVPDKPTASFTASAPTGCLPATVNFINSSTPGCNEIKSYTWNFGDPGSGPANISSLANPSHAYNSNGAYVVWLVVTNCTGSMDSVSQAITINGSGGPSASIISSSNVLCNGDSSGSAAVTASGGAPPYSYYWSPFGGNSPSANGLPAGMYTVLVMDSAGCVDAQTINITQPQAITSGISLTNATCGNNDGVATVTATGGTGALSYLWNPTGQTTATAIGLGTGTYVVTITDSNGCTLTDTAIISNTNGPLAALSQNNILCNGQCTGTALSNTSGGTAPYTYLWSNGATTQNIFNLCAGTYTFTVTDSAGCTNIQSVTLTQPLAMVVSVSVVPANCGAADGTATANPSGGTPGYTFSWSNGQLTQTTTGLASGTYTVTVTDSNGCTQTQFVTVTTTGGPTAAVSASVITISIGQNTVLTATGGGAYLWNTGQTSPSIVVSPTIDTDYCVTVTDANQCTDTACIRIFVSGDSTPCPANKDLSVPNAFSPNNDGQNDVFCLEGWVLCVKHFKVHIYDRWGEEVFSSVDPQFCWDGTYKGKPMDAAVFVYYIEAEMTTSEELVRKGNISLIR